MDDDLTVMFLTPLHAAMNAPPCIFMALSHGLNQLDDGRTVSDVNVVGAMSMDADAGWDSIRTLAAFQRIDSIIALGKTSASLGLPDLEPMTVVNVQIRGQVPPVRCVRLPSPIDPWWLEDDNHIAAGVAVKPLLVPVPTTVQVSKHLAWDRAEFN